MLDDQTTSSSSWIKFPIVDGIGPEKLQVKMVKEVNFVRLPIQDVILCSKKSELHNSSSANSVRFPISYGIGTEKLQSRIVKLSNLVSLPIQVGTDLEKS